MRRRVPGRGGEQSQVVTDSAARQAASPSRLFPLTRLAGWMAEMHVGWAARRGPMSLLGGMGLFLINNPRVP
jgi:hypothetical protein